MMNRNSRTRALTKSALALMLLPLLNACGSDSDTIKAPVPPEIPETPEIPGIADLPTEVAAKFDLLIEAPKSNFEGSIDVYLGRWYACQTAHLNMCDTERAAADGYTIKAVGDPNFGENTKYNVNTPDNSKYHMHITAEELLAWKDQAIRDDIFQPGHYSVLDVMMYISEQRDDFEVTLGEFNEERQTYEYTVSFDADGDGTFDNDPATHYTQWKDYKDSDLWSISFYHSGGKMLGDDAGDFETVYDRLDEMLVRHQTEIRIMPTSPEYRDRMWASQKAEVDFKKANGGKVMLSEITLDMDDTDGYIDSSIHPIATNIEVKAYNLRTDVYRPGVITQLDYVIAAAEASATTGEADFGFTYWPTLSTGSQLGSYVMNRINHPLTGHDGANGLRAEGLDGWNYAAGMEEFTLDVMLDDHYSVSPKQFIEDADGKYAKECKWLREDDGSITEDNARNCLDHWGGTFGGNKLHIALDNMVRNHGMNYIYFSWVKKMFWIYGTTEINSVNEDRQNGNVELFPIAVNEVVDIADISKAIAPLTEDHFGWKIADCALCHGEDEIHLANGELDLVNTAPYACAACHGANGAPDAHGETARCFWCHSEDESMANHGDASKWFDFSEVECAETAAENPTPMPALTVGGTGSCADNVRDINGGHGFVNKQRWDGTRYNDLPAGVTRTRGNSDWHTSETFPDPYSCVTCHLTPEK
ncbi:hypothetical protein KUV56_01765 [Ferrimonas balearica]|uniref:hypothetical protein n=1 Tax=Ferrimonas balearica TaxID=44012 RepID=UPI001C570156|nr:hypothetical protein [Ferrimonas balearica]MBW3138249.1 hypothetical protein [Ferrimonas balearica]